MIFLLIYILSAFVTVTFVYLLSEKVNEYPDWGLLAIMVLAPIINTITAIILPLVYIFTCVIKNYSVESLLKSTIGKLINNIKKGYK